MLERRMKEAGQNASNFGESAIGVNPAALLNIVGVILENERSARSKLLRTLNTHAGG